MTTTSWNTPITHSNDTQFRAWGSEYPVRLAAVGMVQTADTGQINWATVTRAAINTVAGYEIWRFNDTLQGTAPIFFKIEYATGTIATVPIIFITVGTGSNGSGTLTGTLSNRLQAAPNVTATDAVTNWPSYACGVDGFLGFQSKINASASNRGYGAFAICRTCDSSGSPTATGFVLYANPSASGTTTSAQAQAIRTASPATVFPAISTGYFSFVVHQVSNSVDGSDTQAYLHWMPSPKVVPVIGLCTMIASEAPLGTSFVTTLVGTTPRTYISVGIAMGQGGPATSNQHICMLYE